MLYVPVLCNDFAQSSPDPPLFRAPVGAPGSSPPAEWSHSKLLAMGALLWLSTSLPPTSPHRLRLTAAGANGSGCCLYGQ